MGYLNEDGLATLVGKVKGQVVQLTAAEYRQIPAETKNTDNKIYFVEDDDYAYAIDNEPTLNSENLVKSGGVYNYTSRIGTGALTTTAQTLIPAVNELKAEVDTLNTGLTDQTTMNLTLSNATAGGNTSFVTRKGHEVVLFLDYTLNSAATTVTICNLPQKYRPATTIRQIVPAVDSENPAGIFFVVVYPDGDIVSYATKPKRGYITITYPAGN